MGTIWIKEFTGGLDTRKMRETTQGGVLVVATDAHISRGGEIEQRAAFVPTYTLPAGTIGLAYTPAGIVVFGSAPAPVLPAGVSYQRLQHPDGNALDKVLSFDLYRGKIYAVGLFDNGDRLHFFDGMLVADWADGRASASFNVVSGGTTPPAAPSATFEIIGGSAGAPNTLLNLTVLGVAIIGAPVDHTGNNTTTAAAVAAAITSHTSTPNYSATSAGPIVTVTAANTGPALNGQSGVPTLDGAGDFLIGNVTAFAGGANATTSEVTDIKVNGVSIVAAPIVWTGSPSGLADDIAAAISAHTSAPDYDATAAGAKVNILAADSGVAANGFGVTVTAAYGLVLSDTMLTLAGGADLGSAFEPGSFVRTVGSKVYSLSGSNLHFSGIQEPTHWNTDYVGAGFIDLSTYASGAETLRAVAKYQKYIAVFSDRVTQIFFVDPDPTLNAEVQQLNNTGTTCPRSVTQFGDNDLFYLDESGLRSMRARDSSGAAATNDIGVPVDTLVTELLRSMGATERQDVIGLVEPSDGRFWLCMGDTIFVFSSFVSVRVTAWTTYRPGFAIEDAIVFNRKVYVRSDDKIYVYGGLADEPAFDATEPEVWLPYLDANRPTVKKTFQGVDAAVEGNWLISVSLDPTRPEVVDQVANIDRTTYPEQNIHGIGESTHIGVRFKGSGAGPKKIGSVVIHYAGEQLEA